MIIPCSWSLWLKEGFTNKSIIEQVASNKSSLKLKIQIQNAHMSQLFTMNIKTESIGKCF